MTNKEVGAGLGPSGYVEGGGLLDNVDVLWNKVRFEMFDYNGTAPAVPALKVEFGVEEGEDVDQYFSAGSAADWTPSKDGTKLVSIGNARGINKNSNMAILINSLIEAGFPEDKISDDCTIFEGMETHVIRIPAPKRTGLVVTPRADGKVYEKTNLVVDVINRLPWEKKTTKATKATSAGKGKTTATTTAKKEAAAEPESDEINDQATEIVMEIISETGAIDKKKLGTLAFGKLKGDANRNKIVQMLYSDEFLSGGPWEYENGKVG